MYVYKHILFDSQGLLRVTKTSEIIASAVGVLGVSLVLEILWSGPLGGVYPGLLLTAAATSVVGWVFLARFVVTLGLKEKLFITLGIVCVANLVFGLQGIENNHYLGHWYSGSDDIVYLQGAIDFAQNLRQSSNLADYVAAYGTVPHDTTYVGYTVFLAHLSLLVSDDLYALMRISVLFNTFFILLIAGFILRCGQVTQRFWRIFLAVYLTMGFELFYIGTLALKDCTAEILILVATWGVSRLALERISFAIAGLVALALTCLYFIRAPFMLVPPLAVCLAIPTARTSGVLRRITMLVAMVATLLALSITIGRTDWYQRNSNTPSLGLSVSRDVDEQGIAAKVYRIRIAGPMIMAFITPLPPTDMARFMQRPSAIDVLRGLGTAVSLLIMALVAWRAVRKGFHHNAQWLTWAYVAVLVFIPAAYGSTESRHKLPALVAVMICFHYKERSRTQQCLRLAPFQKANCVSRGECSLESKALPVFHISTLSRQRSHAAGRKLFTTKLQ